jgi:hypothetical protein
MDIWLCTLANAGLGRCTYFALQVNDGAQLIRFLFDSFVAVRTTVKKSVGSELSLIPPASSVSLLTRVDRGRPARSERAYHRQQHPCADCRGWQSNN